MQEFNYEDFNQRFGGIARLYGVEGLERLLKARILIVGLGGVGTWAAEALARSGVGSITLVDMDDICITNTNRQIHAMNGMIGKMKVIASRDRILAINPQCKVNAIEEFFTSKTCEQVLTTSYDYVIDAIDSLQNKCVLAAACKEKNIPLITIGGAAGKRNPAMIKVDDLGLACNDSLLFSLRKRLRQEFSFPSGAGHTRSKKQIFHIACVYSPEEPMFPKSDGTVCAVAEGNLNLRLDCTTGMGSITHITGIFGFLAASHVINQITCSEQLTN
ncbi:MAG: tRNA threonylcarbamoyladenosine dehydratase [Bacteriovorax sp.]|jgi:tRNA A37 threonylcarbamoyladenosine dehydratase|nr:tRNA threonylcarbamoyladenosine dehydratase [Bacteriovorax sp.]